MRTETVYRDVDSPVGKLRVACCGENVVAILTGTQLDAPVPQQWRRDPALRAPAIDQLAEYFAGTRTEFDLSFDLEGTPFQVQVWQALASIPFGQSITYAELARRVGRPGAFRAVGSTNARNPLSIVLPCHRVVGADGQLTGYAGGLYVKGALLEHERRVLGVDPARPSQRDLLTSGGLSA